MKTISGSSSTTVARIAAALALAALAGAPSVATAAEPGHARADALFREGRALLDAKKYDEACPKLAESQKAEPGSGTLLALALCHEGQGKTATAHRELLETAALARKNGRQDLASAAEKRAKAMEPTLTKLVVRVPDDDSTTYAVRLDDQPVADESRGKPIVVDPGEHRIVASATGRVARSYVVRATGGTVEIVIDQLDEEEKAAPAVVPAAKPARATPVKTVTDEELTHASGASDREPGSNGTAQKVIGLTLMGGGVAGLVGSGVYAAQAVSARSDARNLQGAAADSANDRARTKTMISVVSGSVGVVVLAVGTILLVTAPSKSSATVGQSYKPRAQLVPMAGPGELGAGFVGAF